VLAVSLLTAGCGGSATASTPTGSPPPAVSTAPASAGSSSTSTSPSAASGGDGTALCAFLTSEIPKIQAAGSTGGAVAMDTLTEVSCPEIRANVLKIVGGDSFANGL
jgi:hypothetical protein